MIIYICNGLSLLNIYLKLNHCAGEGVILSLKKLIKNEGKIILCGLAYI